MKFVDHIEVNELFKRCEGKSVGIVTHVNPDGDGLGAALALSYCLENVYFAEPIIVMETKFPETLGFLVQESGIRVQKSIDDSFDLLVVLDCHEKDRVDADIGIFDLANEIVVIDHHVFKGDDMKGAVYYIDSSAVSTGVMVNRFLYKHVKAVNADWKKDYADCIYATILNDTDNFINSNTDKETFQVVSDLMELGLKPHVITNQFLYRKSIYYYRFIGAVLSTIEVRNKIAMYQATLKMLADNQQTTEAYAKMMRWTKGSYDVDLQVLFQEYEGGLYRIGLRSELHDVAKIAQHFGGGGHVKASGFEIKGEFDLVKNEVIKYIESVIT